VTLAIHHRLRADGGTMPDLALVTDKPNLPTRRSARCSGSSTKPASCCTWDSVPRASMPKASRSRTAIASPPMRSCARRRPRPSPWLAASGLAYDERGFVRVDDHLRSVSHAHVFAAGDCASQDGRLASAIGRLRVRQGPPLAYNLRAAATGMPLQPYRPQPDRAGADLDGGPARRRGVGAGRVRGRLGVALEGPHRPRFMRRYRVDA
jgi:hypothetical protein